ncbi:PTS-dependent dihydroxyacetone kinase, ADP-binding subunit DhaL [Variovorax sp. SRS16]|uniref:dihydroxyacetone kinase subunit L n=1 Tax=Variovorax sp. SRS16 TaxID=282217 RepID=UPI0013184E79|nr:dihydroxyacetone kinase subunit L [Variovorax sp. SRS16]VTU13259.1 PTS-dependent dihydroxyacetone kinase, ADP-binding subunit DhaL [Variovorax sp. SRS16]
MPSPTDLHQGLERWATALHESTHELNALDGRLGDGDLGTTLDKCASNVREALPALPQDFAGIFRSCAAACAKASGSSFGTLLALAFMTASKHVSGVERLDRPALVRLLDAVTTSLGARGGAAFGDKTMLDSIDAIARALEAAPDDAELRTVAIDAAREALDTYRSKPNRIGRARMFADKSIGMDDPGMVAVHRMTQSLQA